jgi:D-serine deaminase-like pyridoxal phosphate-dependent protein
MKQAKVSRRQFLYGGLAVGSLAGIGALKPRAKGERHSAYFEEMSAALKAERLAKPTLLIDKAKLLENVVTLQKNINQRFAYRIVVKSLPSIPLLALLMKSTQSNRLMLFHQNFVQEIAAAMPHADILLGKPMPVLAAESTYQFFLEQTVDFNHEKQLQWLIDSEQRLQQYALLAKKLNVPMQINIELDIGLHRGGVKNTEELESMLALIEEEERLSFSGFMGYEPHVAALPGPKEKHRDEAQKKYLGFVKSAEAFLRRPISDLTLNCAGSPTYQLYNHGDYCFNELAAGSCLVKPTDFDIETLADHVPASYIATPILKSLRKNPLPINYVADFWRAWDPNKEKSFFTYGGYWKALPESPQGLEMSPIMRSTNQDLYFGPEDIGLEQDDYIFLRPTQSEFVFLQFGDIAVYEGGRITAYWPILSNG